MKPMKNRKPFSNTPDGHTAVDAIQTTSNPDTSSTSEDGEIDELDSHGEEGELTADGERALLDAVISKDLKSGGKDIAQKDARYFKMQNVVCDNCGVKGHMSFDCPEEVEKKRCFLCGKPGHDSKNCPKELCFICKEPGHRAKECPNRNLGSRQLRKKRELRRNLRPPRPPKLTCYVCGENGHLDCSLSTTTPGLLSCHNCGAVGHAAQGCDMCSVDRILPIVLDMDRERRQKDDDKSSKRSTKSKKRKRPDTPEESRSNASEDDVTHMKNAALTAKEYHDRMMSRIRERRYSRRTFASRST
eukprot:GFKZ01005365.1.p1 GENE.GFKZ01005365.1~~GFKZ01005365.1.p1  ORF type:complete len:302 (+),score=33.22 GFKZ01005365.1:168-1073(+)